MRSLKLGSSIRKHHNKPVERLVLKPNWDTPKFSLLIASKDSGLQSLSSDSEDLKLLSN